MAFTQIITVEGADQKELEDLMRTWDEEQAGVAPGYQGARILADEESDECMLMVDFASKEEAERNNEREVTQSWAEQLRSLARGEPSYRNMRPVASTRD